MTMAESIKSCFVKYADFTGCATRSEFWWWSLFNLIASLALEVISDKLSLAFSIATLLPYCAVTTRRLHDIDRSGWFQLIALIPFAGWILLIIWCAEEGKPSNRYASEIISRVP